MDDAIDLLSLDGPGGGTAGGPKNKDVEKHPERRFKAALAAYTEREMPKLKIEHPGLRKQQMEQLIYKNFQKSPENPFNQANLVDYNATQEDVKESKGKYSDCGFQRPHTIPDGIINFMFNRYSSTTCCFGGPFEKLNR